MERPGRGRFVVESHRCGTSAPSTLGQRSSPCESRLEGLGYQQRTSFSGEANPLPPIISRFEFIAIACIGGKSMMPSGTPCMTLCTVYSSSATISWSDDNCAAEQMSELSTVDPGHLRGSPFLTSILSPMPTALKSLRLIGSDSAPRHASWLSHTGSTAPRFPNRHCRSKFSFEVPPPHAAHTS